MPDTGCLRRWSMLAIAVSVCTTLVACTAGGAASPERAGDRRADAAATSFGPLVDLRQSMQAIDGRNFRLQINMPQGVAKDKGTAGLSMDLSFYNGRWHAGTARTPRYNTALHTCEAVDATSKGDRITGRFRVNVRPDAWVPADKKPRTIDVQLDLTFGREHASDQSGDDVDFRNKRFWTVFARAQSSYRPVEGTFRTTFEGREATGQVTGRLTRPLAPEQWNMGAWDEQREGVAFAFDMGKKRQNWNHARLAQISFDPPRDFTDARGFRIAIETDRPRPDVEVTVWLREADGSWYYLKSAVPLIDEKNEAVALFEDFAEAEWVSPTNHMDEDYVLDLSSITHLGLGVVNPLGVGKVGYTVTALDVLSARKVQRLPAKVAVTGRTLSINEHTVLPAGVVGGYAGYLKQEYRPGCQRNLYAPSYPRVPRQHFVHFSGNSFSDWAGMIDILNGKVAGEEAIGKHLMGLVTDEKVKLGLTRFNMEKHKKSRNPESAPKALTGVLTSILRNRSVHNPALWQGVKLDDQIKGRLSKIGKLNDTELMEMNRWLLEARFSNHIKPVPRHGPTEAYYIDCLGERKEPAWLLNRSNWKQAFEDYGKAFANNARRAGYIAHFEFWNEPYLNWAERSRVNLNSRYYTNEDGKVRVKYKDGKLGPVIPHFKWEGGKVVDETAFSYWSGKGNGWIYDQMFAAVASSIKKHNPETRVIAGWGFRWNEDHWAAWDMLYKPTIDRGIEWIDALHEHHYQGDTTAMNGSYEVAVAYVKTKYDKWIHCYNTETNDLVDAPARGAIDTPDKARAAKNYRRMCYNLRDILYCFAQSPDKFIARTMIHPEQTPDATHVTYTMLKNLRGRLIETASDDNSVWCVASVDGTDPKAMPPDYDGVQKLVVFVFNDHRKPRAIETTINAPEGTTFAGPATVERNTTDKESFQIALKAEQAKVSGRQAQFSLDLPERAAWKITIPLKGEITKTNQVQRSQCFSADILQAVPRGKTFSTVVPIDRKLLDQATRAWLRIVIEDVAPGEGTVTVGNRRIEMPKAYTADNVNRILELPVDLKALSTETPVVFSVDQGNHAGYRVDMTSIVLETREE